MQTKIGIHSHGSDGEPGLNSLSPQDTVTLVGNQNSNVVAWQEDHLLDGENNLRNNILYDSFSYDT